MVLPGKHVGLLLTLVASIGIVPTLLAQDGTVAVVRGRLIAADGGEAGGLRVVARVGMLTDSTESDAEGRFAVALGDAATVDSIELSVAGMSVGAPVYQSSLVRLIGKDLDRELEIVVIPLRWTIVEGRYAGTAVDVPLSRAFTRACATCSAFYRFSTGDRPSGRESLQGWPAKRFPLQVAFDREWPALRVTPRDSAQFWSEVDALEAAFGADVFRPVTFEEARPRETGGPDDAILVWVDPALRNSSGLGSSVGNGHDIEYGDVRLHRGALRGSVGGEGLVAHELMHTLGFGHTCAWRSVLADVRRCPELRASTATPEDVAYAQLAARLRRLLAADTRRWGVEAALAAAE
ncbi:MAG TPA: hypothetical protein VEW03_02035, partial [Longimicrobiaceae bacterium]|nr:hypothetical protein [Longimicrobiaceae bacterium]